MSQYLLMNRNTYLTLNIGESMREQISKLIVDERVKIMDKDSLHITFLFCGELLHKISNNDLVIWNIMLNEMISECSVPHMNVIDFALFPPEKQNLIVAIMHVSPSIIELQKQIVEYTDSLGGTFSEIANMNRDWIPHITLGKIQAKKSEVKQVGTDIINNFSSYTDSHNSDGISVSGMMPIRMNDGLKFSKFKG